jgi:hypothetical protein
MERSAMREVYAGTTVSPARVRAALLLRVELAAGLAVRVDDGDVVGTGRFCCRSGTGVDDRVGLGCFPNI